MLYFFHHYELPLILRQVQIQNILIRTSNASRRNPTETTSAPPSPSGQTEVPVSEAEVTAAAYNDDDDAQDGDTTMADRGDSPVVDISSDDSEMELATDGTHMEAAPSNSSLSGRSSKSDGGETSSSSSSATATTSTVTDNPTALSVASQVAENPTDPNCPDDLPTSLLQ